MARQVLPILGGLVGAYFGYPQLGFVIGGLLGGLADPAVAQGPKLGELAVQSFDEGSPRAIIHGTSQCSGYVMEAGQPIKTTEVMTGEKGAPKSEQEVVYRNYAIAICEGPIQGILRVWEDDKLVFDVRPGSMLLAESIEWMSDKVFYLGDESQVPDIFMAVNISGILETPAFRGTAYMFALLDDLTDRRGAIPQFRFEVSSSSTQVPLEKVPSNDFGLNSVAGGMFDGDSFEAFQEVDAGDRVMLAHATFFAPDVLPGVSTTFTVTFDDIIVHTEVFAGNGSVGVQINPLGKAVRVTAVTTNGSGFTIGVGGTAQTTAGADIRPWPSLLNPDYVPYYGGAVAPDVIQSTDPYYGILNDDPDGMKAASWGPDSYMVIGTPVTLASIVSDLHSRAGLFTSEYEVSELEEVEVSGITFAGEYTAASAIDVLRSCYFFDKSEPGDKIWYPMRGKPVVLTLDVDDLVEVPDLSRREQISEIPKKLHLHYANATAGYAPIKVSYMRSSQDMQSVLESSIQVPVVLDVNEAAQMVEKMYKVTASDAQGEIKLSVPDSFIRLVPSDCIGLNLRGQVRRLRIDNVELTDGVMELTCRVDRQSAYTSVLTGIPVEPPTLPPSTIIGETVFKVLDIPARIDSEDDLHYLVAGVGEMPAWAGWAYQRSLDGGANYTTVQRIEKSAVMGTLLDPLPAASEHYTDVTNTVRVQLIREGHVLEDLTDLQFLGEQGAFALENADGSWEILQYLDADDEGDGVFALTTLHRGLLNTGGTAHTAGASFVRLDRAVHIDAQSAWLNMNITHRGVGLGAPPEGADEITQEFEGRSQIEWPVTYLDLARDVSDVITGTWIPRHRFGSDVNPVASLNFTGYRVVLDDGTTAVSFDVATPQFTYDASALSSPLDVSVSPLNRITGAGPAVTESI